MRIVNGSKIEKGEKQEMKALTLMQPFATLVAIGAKTNETRSWKTIHRGRIAIHASARITPEFQRICQAEPFRGILKKAGYRSWRDLPRGAVLCTISLTECKEIIEENQEKQYAILEDETMVADNEFYFGDYTPGRYAWQLQDVSQFNKPIQAKGQLSLWEWNDPRTTQIGGKPSDR